MWMTCHLSRLGTAWTADTLRCRTSLPRSLLWDQTPRTWAKAIHTKVWSCCILRPLRTSEWALSKFLVHQLSRSPCAYTRRHSVVHVLGVDSEEERLPLYALLTSAVESERREFVFNTDVASLLVGDFATQSIESQSLQLLDGLIYFQRHDKQVSIRTCSS